jgi:hypothetical protein
MVPINSLKGIVSRDWGRLSMVLLDSLKFVRSRLRFIFNLKFIFQSNFFKMASVRVHLSLDLQ